MHQRVSITLICKIAALTVKKFQHLHVCSRTEEHFKHHREATVQQTQVADLNYLHVLPKDGLSLPGGDLACSSHSEVLIQRDSTDHVLAEGSGTCPRSYHKMYRDQSSPWLFLYITDHSGHQLWGNLEDNLHKT